MINRNQNGVEENHCTVVNLSAKYLFSLQRNLTFALAFFPKTLFIGSFYKKNFF